RQDGADDRSAHHLKITGLKRNERDDELRRIAEGGVEQTSYGIASAPGDLLGGLHDQRRDRHNGQRRGEEDHRRRHFASVLENDGEWNEREQPVNGEFHEIKLCWLLSRRCKFPCSRQRRKMRLRARTSEFPSIPRPGQTAATR